MNHLYTGKINQINDSGALAGDVCLTDDWSIAKATGAVAWLEGRSNGSVYDLEMVITEEDEITHEMKRVVIGSINYNRLPVMVKGLVGYGKLKIKADKEHGVKAEQHMIAVFRDTENKLSLDGGVTSEVVAYHRFKMMTLEEQQRFLPKGKVCVGGLM